MAWCMRKRARTPDTSKRWHYSCEELVSPFESSVYTFCIYVDHRKLLMATMRRRMRMRMRKRMQMWMLMLMVMPMPMRMPFPMHLDF